SGIQGKGYQFQQAIPVFLWGDLPGRRGESGGNQSYRGAEVSRNIKVGEYSDPAASLEDASVLLSYRQRRHNIKTDYDLSLYRDGSHITVYKEYYNRTGGYTKTPGKEENVYGDSGWISFCVCRRENSDQRLPGGKSAG